MTRYIGEFDKMTFHRGNFDLRISQDDVVNIQQIRYVFAGEGSMEILGGILQLSPWIVAVLWIYQSDAVNYR